MTKCDTVRYESEFEQVKERDFRFQIKTEGLNLVSEGFHSNFYVMCNYYIFSNISYL